jgi:hypothetical protein
LSFERLAILRHLAEDPELETRRSMRWTKIKAGELSIVQILLIVLWLRRCPAMTHLDSSQSFGRTDESITERFLMEN